MESKVFTNRNGNHYWFEPTNDGSYIMRGNLNYWRYGGKEGDRTINPKDLGFVDPSGGPFVYIGYKIGDKHVTKISVDDWENPIITLKVE